MSCALRGPLRQDCRSAPPPRALRRCAWPECDHLEGRRHRPTGPRSSRRTAAIWPSRVDQSGALPSPEQRWVVERQRTLAFPREVCAVVRPGELFVRRRTALACAALGVVPLVAMAQSATAGNAPTFRQYTSPAGVDTYVGLPPTGLPHTGNYSQSGIGDSCGEPTLGVDRKTGAVLYQCGLQTLRVTAFDKKGAGSATWTDVTGLLEGYQTSDPILYTDPTTRRTWVNQLDLQGC